MSPLSLNTYLIFFDFTSFIEANLKAVSNKSKRYFYMLRDFENELNSPTEVLK